MDWFKHLKRKQAYRWDDFTVWWFAFDFPYYRYYTDMQFQVFPDGHSNPAPGLSVKPYEFRCSILVAYQTGFNFATGIFIDKDVFDLMSSDKNANWWKVFPKEKIKEFLSDHPEICQLMIKTVFEKTPDSLEK